MVDRSSIVERYLFELDRQGVLDAKIEAVLRNVHRERFVTHELVPTERDQWMKRSVSFERAYETVPIVIRTDGHGHAVATTSPIDTVEVIRAASLRRGLDVLEVGGGTGYSTAVMSGLVGKQGLVTSFELDGELATLMRKNLDPAANCDVRNGNGLHDFGADARVFDRIVVWPSVYGVSPLWLKQLRPCGRLVSVLDIDAVQVLFVADKPPNGQHLIGKFTRTIRYHAPHIKPSLTATPRETNLDFLEAKHSLDHRLPVKTHRDLVDFWFFAKLTGTETTLSRDAFSHGGGFGILLEESDQDWVFLNRQRIYRGPLKSAFGRLQSTMEQWISRGLARMSDYQVLVSESRRLTSPMAVLDQPVDWSFGVTCCGLGSCFSVSGHV